MDDHNCDRHLLDVYSYEESCKCGQCRSKYLYWRALHDCFECSAENGEEGPGKVKRFILALNEIKKDKKRCPKEHSKSHGSVLNYILGKILILEKPYNEVFDQRTPKAQRFNQEFPEFKDPELKIILREAFSVFIKPALNAPLDQQAPPK